ncbi:MAG: glycosyltransferase family 39 protein [Nanoarchaeota archaeon]|nr:glycosyltransferase family 39 protein [Nanoarchaeota archaeon]
MNEEQKIEEKKEKVKELFKEPYKIAIGVILMLGILVRFYFYNIAKDQAHWWDTLAYGGLAKNIILNLWNDNTFLAHEAIIRPPLLPWIWSILLRFGLSDAGTIILLEIIPSVLCIWFIYLIAKELYDEKIGLISAFIASFSWVFLFYSLRIMTDMPSLFFSLVSIYYFLKSYEEVKSKEFAISVAFLALAVITRYSYGVLAVVYIIFLAIIHKHHFLKKKGFWVGGLTGAIPLVLFFLFNLVKYGSLLPASSIYSQSASEKAGFGFYILEFVPYILQKLLLIIFLLGLALVLWEIIIGFDTISKIKRIRSHIFNILLIAGVFFFFIFIIRAAEDRYLMTAMPVMFMFIGLVLMEIYKLVKSYSKNLAIFLVLGILLFGAYSQVTFGKSLIENKKESYKQMKEAFEWIKVNTEKEAILGGDGIDPYVIYYSERKIALNYTADDLPGYSKRADYIILHRFEYQTEKLVNYVNENTGEDKIFTPLYASFFDAEQKQPAVIVYKVNKDKIVL